jgi:hypothetical protein
MGKVLNKKFENEFASSIWNFELKFIAKKGPKSN